MKPGEILMRTLRVAARECGQIARNPIYLFCMVVFPIVVTFFFTSILDEGQPAKLPRGRGGPRPVGGNKGHGAPPQQFPGRPGQGGLLPQRRGRAQGHPTGRDLWFHPLSRRHDSRLAGLQAAARLVLLSCGHNALRAGPGLSRPQDDHGPRGCLGRPGETPDAGQVGRGDR